MPIMDVLFWIAVIGGPVVVWMLAFSAWLYICDTSEDG